LTRFDRLNREILNKDGLPSGALLPFGMEHLADQAAEMWSTEWRGIVFKLVTRYNNDVVVASLQFASEKDEACYLAGFSNSDDDLRGDETE
jgi:hypothetical protein